MARRQSFTPAPRDRATQWDDLSPKSRQVVAQNVRDSGRQRDALDLNISRLKAASQRADVKPATVTKNKRLAGNLETLRPQIQNVNITPTSAARARENLFTDAESRMSGEGRQYPRGYGWYFEHHGAIAGAAQQHGFDTQRAIAASGTMSPQNSPENERAALTELMKIHASNPTVNVTSQGAKFLGLKRGTSQVNAHDLNDEQIGKLGAAKYRQHIQVNGGVDQVQLSRGGAHGQIAKASGVLRGQAAGEAVPALHDIANPRTSAKIHSYLTNISGSVPGSGVHDEYMARYQDRRNPTQGRLDLHGLKNSTAGVLNPKGPTAEDTWMNSFSTGQSVKATGRASLAKTIGSMKDMLGVGRRASINGKQVSVDADPSTSNEALRHAYNNHATHLAAQHLSKSMETKMPAVAAQEVPWVEGRIQAGKDPAFNQSVGAGAKGMRSQAKAEAKTLKAHQDAHQGGFFKDVKSGGLEVNRKHLPPATHRVA